MALLMNARPACHTTHIPDSDLRPLSYLFLHAFLRVSLPTICNRVLRYFHILPPYLVLRMPPHPIHDARPMSAATMHGMRVSCCPASFPCPRHVALLRRPSALAWQVRLHGCSVRTAYCSHALLICSAHIFDHVFGGQGALGRCL